MEIRIKKPLAFSEIGLKDNQEDSIYPLPGNMSKSDRLFVLCDGMGGHENGEVASRTVCDAIGYYFENHMQLRKGMTVKDYFLSALDYAYNRLDEEDTGGERKMGTTMTCVYLHSSGVLVAHIGDSRIYQIRPSLYDCKSGCLGIVYQSEDHSLVNDLLKIGEITPEEAENFPRKNVITRAMQPNQERRAKADVFSFDDVKAGDYFFMCSDGILEQMTNAGLAEIISDSYLEETEKISRIKTVCDGGTKDNYTCILVPVKDVQREDKRENDTDSDTIEVVIDTTHAVEKDEVCSTSDEPKCRSLNSRYIWVILLAVSLISLSYIGYVKFNHGNIRTVAPIERTDSMIQDRQLGDIDSLTIDRQDTNDIDNTVIKL